MERDSGGRLCGPASIRRFEVARFTSESGRRSALIGSRVLGLFLALLVVACAPRVGWQLKPDAHLSDASISESSGFVLSRQYDDVFWTHNDSGHTPEIYAVEEDGRLIRSYRIPGASNHDWEDIAIDDRGNLFVLENISRSDPKGRTALYVIPEPNPYSDPAIMSAGIHYFTFPRGAGPFDCEALFVWGTDFYVVTKPWDGNLPMVYKGTTLTGGGELEFFTRISVPAMITGADVSEDGNRVALSSYRALLIYQGDGGPEEALRSDPIVCQMNARQVEAVSWDGDRIVLTNEQSEIFRISRSRWLRQQAPFLRRPEESIPFVNERFSVHLSLDEWPRGRWLRSRFPEEARLLGRVNWSSEGLHIGLELPSDVELSTVDPRLAEDTDQWFLPGIVYLMVNPDGHRPLTYGENDRCVVFTRSQDGKAIARSLSLSHATLVQSLEKTPSWIRVQESDRRLLITVTPEAPGFGRLSGKREIGFNVILIREGGNLLSWAPLTRRFSWDQPNVWGLLQLKN